MSRIQWQLIISAVESKDIERGEVALELQLKY